MKKIVIIGGGTFSPIRNHLSLCAPAFGTTAKALAEIFASRSNYVASLSNFEIKLKLTKMADPSSHLVTNDDVKDFIEELINDASVNTIIMNAALCDYNAEIDGVPGDFHGDRLKTAEGPVQVKLTPAEKVISDIRKVRPDIFLVAFKTTTGATKEEQFLTALKMMKSSKCNLVLANDTVTRHNMIVTPEEVKYEIDDWVKEPFKKLQKEHRDRTLKLLVDMIIARHKLTYTRTNFIQDTSVPFSDAPDTFQKVLRHVIERGGFIENNGNGFTPGHFCYKISKGVFVSSQRKVNHNDVAKNGMTLVKVNGDKVTAIGSHKPSVGAQSQAMLLERYPEYDCILHVHCPLTIRGNNVIPSTPQKPFQCGSIECGMNTLEHIKEFIIEKSDTFMPDVKVMAVMLEKHGPNFMFKSSDSAEEIIEYIDRTVELGTKIS